MHERTEVFSLRKLFDDVWAFHAAFNYDNRDKFSGEVTREQLMARLKFLRSEYQEICDSTTSEEVVDGAIDELYFAVGTMCQSGLKPVPSDFTVVFKSTLARYLDDYEVAVKLRDAKYMQWTLCSISMLVTGYLAMVGVSMVPQWEAVHGANMRKLGPDGKPIINPEDGKILKPEGWVGPDNATPLLADGYDPEGVDLLPR